MTTVDGWAGREVQALREALRLSKRALANQMGVTHRTITNWENEMVTISPFSKSLLDQRLHVADDSAKQLDLV
jgi:DNA-binding transcriptional regulator YiaG